MKNTNLIIFIIFILLILYLSPLIVSGLRSNISIYDGYIEFSDPEDDVKDIFDRSTNQKPNIDIIFGFAEKKGKNIVIEMDVKGTIENKGDIEESTVACVMYSIVLTTSNEKYDIIYINKRCKLYYYSNDVEVEIFDLYFLESKLSLSFELHNDNEIIDILEAFSMDYNPAFPLIFYYDEAFSEPYNNKGPNKPEKPIGENMGKIKLTYNYISSATDPDGDQIYYYWDWDDGSNSGWLGPYNSGDQISTSHSWNEQGIYNIRVKAKDIYGRESEWSEPLSVNMPKNKFLRYIILDSLMVKFPSLERIIF